jgi:hypothetical protein
VLNLPEIVKTALSASADCLANLYANGRYADTRVLVFSTRFWNRVVPSSESIDDARGRYLEHVVADTMWSAASDGWTCDYLISPPRIVGRSAATGKIYRGTWSEFLTEDLKLRIKRWRRPLRSKREHHS